MDQWNRWTRLLHCTGGTEKERKTADLGTRNVADQLALTSDVRSHDHSVSRATQDTMFDPVSRSGHNITAVVVGA